MKYTFADAIRYERYLSQNGWFFASNDGMDEWAQTKVKSKVLKPLFELIPHLKDKESWGSYKSNWAYAYVPLNFTVEDLTKIFTTAALNGFGLHQFGYTYDI